MKFIIWYWNLLHFNLYVWQKTAHRIFNYINPFVWINKIPVIKKFYAKHGIHDMNKFSDDVVFNDKSAGINSVWAGVNIGGLFILLEFVLFNILQGIAGKPLIKYIWENKTYAIVFILLFLVFAGIFNYFVLFKDDKYLSYFDEFEKLPKAKQNRYNWSCFATVLLILSLFIISLTFVPN